MDIIAYSGTALAAIAMSGFSLLRIIRGEKAVIIAAPKSSGWHLSANNLVLVVIFGFFGLMLVWKSFSLWREERKWRRSK